MKWGVGTEEGGVVGWLGMGVQRDSAEMFFFFLCNNPVIWSLMVSLEISSIKALFCLPKEFFQFLAPPPPQGFHYLA